MLFSCESEPDVITPVTKTVPIVYAVIDPYDSIKSVRVEPDFHVQIAFAGLIFNDTCISSCTGKITSAFI